MNEDYQNILDYWLTIDFKHIANKAGFLAEKELVQESYIAKSIHVLDKMTRDANLDKNYVITIIALMWEYIDSMEYDIRQAVLLYLSRIGYPTSAVICDDSFEKKDCLFMPVNSYLQGLSITAYQQKNRVSVYGRVYLLTDYQKKIWEAIESHEKVIGISAPTSAGKSFVIALKIMDELSRRDFDVIYIVPTLSLINQVSEDFNNLKNDFNINDCYISSSFEEKSLENNYIYVLTQEKAIASIESIDDENCKPIMLVVDEVQNIEKIQDDNDERSRVLYDVLMEFRYKQNVSQIIISGPRIDKVEKVASSLFIGDALNCSTDVSPVLSITYSISKLRGKYVFKQYCSLNNQFKHCYIEDDSIIAGYGRKQYSDAYLKYLNILVKR